MNEKSITSEASKRRSEVTIKWETWKELRRLAGRQIDPAEAEVVWWWGQLTDPYSVFGEVPEECDCIGRIYFARNADSNVWIEFNDLPQATRTALRQKTIVDQPSDTAVPS